MLKINRNRLFLKCKILIITLFFIACDNFFEYSVYESNITSENKNTTTKNLHLLKSIDVTAANFKFAFVTDNHYFYKNLRTVIDDINKREDILFVIFGGDIADQALLKEFEIFHSVMKNLKKPYLTVIGNHDYHSNGAAIYKKMFGDYNYSFEFNGNKFILFDDVVWESNKTPDFDWLTKELANNELYKQVFVIAHIPPYGDQFDIDIEQTYRLLMEKNKVALSIHGHTHSYFYEENRVSYLTIPSLKEPTYCIINVESNSFSTELIEL